MKSALFYLFPSVTRATFILRKLGVPPDELFTPGSCPDTSSHPGNWTIQSWASGSLIEETAPSNDTSAQRLQSCFVSFQLFNPALKAAAQCSVSRVDPPDSFGTCFAGEGADDPERPGPWLDCGNTTALVSVRDARVLNGSAVFRMTGEGRRMEVNQTWACQDMAEDPHYYYSYIWHGNSSLSPNCSTDEWTNPDWKSGQIYERTNKSCTMPDFALYVNEFVAWG